MNDQDLPAEPPARIAARFYRNPRDRRRTSTHSSRRSSISSRHSRASALSSHGGPYSTHVAQHLRRASIIETRKARLAERAAHAEQVRLRAAAAKAVPRTSNIEEKAAAAQAAREKLLAEIAARCEEDVKRAKRIAEEMKEKRAAEHARLVDEMNEKYANAARRRSNYQSTARRTRTSSLAAVEELKMDPTHLRRMSQSTAVKVIQRAWRLYQARKIAKVFNQAGISVEQLSSMKFDEVTKLIASEEIMSATLETLRYFGLLDGESEDIARRGAARVFLSSFVIASHPVAAFSQGGKQPKEQELKVKARALTSAIESTTGAALARGSSIYNRETLQFLFHDFTSNFHAWKSQDLGVIADVMVGSFVNLDAILHSTQNDENADVVREYQQAVRTEQTKILVRLKRLLGPDQALTRVKSAVRKARRARAAQTSPSSSQHIPRATTPTDMDLDISASAILTAPPHPDSHSRDVNQPLPTPPTTPARARQPQADASAFVQRLGGSMTVLPSNREIAHEIQINGTFEIEQQPWTDARKDLTDSWRQGMRECIRVGGKPEEAKWVAAMVTLIRAKLFNLVSEKHPLRERISQFLDADLLSQQSYHGALDYGRFFQTIAQVLAEICSPGRDEIVREFASDEASDLIDRLFSLINILDLMSLDHINFQFRIASRQVVEHGHEHEYSSFENDLGSGVHSLDHARAWWRNGKAHVSGVPTGTTAYANAVYARALTDLVLGNRTLQFDDVPETLGLDYLRLHKLRARVFQAVATASVLLTSKIRLRRNREALWTLEAERLMKLDFLSIDVSRIVSIIASSHLMPESTRSGLTDFVSRVIPAASAACRKLKRLGQDRAAAVQSHRAFHPAQSQAETETGDVFSEQIATFILKSLREHVYARLAASSAADKARVTSSASETLARIGMPEFVGEINAVVDMLEKIRAVDLRAHEKWYDEIAREVNG